MGSITEYYKIQQCGYMVHVLKDIVFYVKNIQYLG